jgi:small nuclear ribonucleoprotein (snRNP)-like protein
MDKLLFIKLQGNRTVSGYLRGFDIFLNLVLDETREEGSADKIECGTVVSSITLSSSVVMFGKNKKKMGKKSRKNQADSPTPCLFFLALGYSRQ